MYQLPKLQYSFQELEPFIDTHTLGLHYHKHEQNYLNKLNSLLEKSNYDYRYSLCELLFHLNEFPECDRENILFNLGGVLNHNLYWKSMHPNNEFPKDNLKMCIENKYGSFEKFKDKFKQIAMSLKGSGYTFLVIKEDGTLDIINTSNQETPLIKGFIPIFNIDLWEHAYYLNYKNEKEKYINNFFEIANFTYANSIFNNLVN